MKESIRDILESNESVSIIADGDIIAEVGLDMLEEGYEFVETGRSEILKMLRDNDILSIAKDGCDYFIQEVFSEEGITLRDEVADRVYIQEDLLDCVDLEAFDGEIIYICEELDEAEEYIDKTLESMVEETLEDIEEFSDDNEFCPHCRLIDLVKEAFEFGYEQALEDLDEI